MSHRFNLHNFPVKQLGIHGAFSKFGIKSQSEFSGTTFQSSLAEVEEIYTFFFKTQVTDYGERAIDGKILNHIQANIVLFVMVG